MELKNSLTNSAAFQAMLEAEKAAQAEAEVAQAQAEAEAAEAEARAVYESELCQCVEAAYLVAAADGRTSPEEVDRLAKRMCDLSSHTLEHPRVQEMIGLAEMRLHAEGQESRIQSIAAAMDTPDKREAALMVAAGVSWTGGGVSAKEGLALQALSRAFDIPIESMHKILAKAHA